MSRHAAKLSPRLDCNPRRTQLLSELGQLLFASLDQCGYGVVLHASDHRNHPPSSVVFSDGTSYATRSCADIAACHSPSGSWHSTPSSGFTKGSSRDAARDKQWPRGPALSASARRTSRASLTSSSLVRVPRRRFSSWLHTVANQQNLNYAWACKANERKRLMRKGEWEKDQGKFEGRVKKRKRKTNKRRGREEGTRWILSKVFFPLDMICCWGREFEDVACKPGSLVANVFVRTCLVQYQVLKKASVIKSMFTLQVPLTSWLVEAGDVPKRTLAFEQAQGCGGEGLVRFFFRTVVWVPMRVAVWFIEKRVGSCGLALGICCCPLLQLVFLRNIVVSRWFFLCHTRCGPAFGMYPCLGLPAASNFRGAQPTQCVVPPPRCVLGSRFNVWRVSDCRSSWSTTPRW